MPIRLKDLSSDEITKVRDRIKDSPWLADILAKAEPALAAELRALEALSNGVVATVGRSVGPPNTPARAETARARSVAKTRAETTPCPCPNPDCGRRYRGLTKEGAAHLRAHPHPGGRLRSMPLAPGAVQIAGVHTAVGPTP